MSFWPSFLSPNLTKMSDEQDKNDGQKGHKHMWLEKVIAARKAQGLTTKVMAEKSRMHLTERTITRILNRETKAPKIDVILDIGATVGLSAQQLFSETDLVPFDRDELDRLKNQVKELNAENELLRLKVEYQDTIIGLLKRCNQIDA